MEGFLGLKTKKFGLISLLFVCLSFVLCGCKEEEIDDSVNHVYKAEDIALSDNYSISNEFKVCSYEDGFCLYAMIDENKLNAVNGDMTSYEDIDADLYADEDMYFGEEELFDEEEGMDEEEPMDEDNSDSDAAEDNPEPTPEPTPVKTSVTSMWDSKTDKIKDGTIKDDFDYMAGSNPKKTEDLNETETEKVEYVPHLFGKECFYFFDKEGNELRKFSYDLIDERLRNVFISPSGEIFILSYVKMIDEYEDYPEPDDWSHIYGKLTKLNGQGEILKSIRIDELPDVRKLSNIMPDYTEWDRSYNLLGGGDYIAVLACYNLLTFDYNFNLVNVIKSEKINENFSEIQTVLDNQGQTYGYYWDVGTSDNKLGKADLLKGTVENGILPLNVRYLPSGYGTGKDAQFILFVNGNMCEYNYGDTEPHTLIDFTASNISVDNVSSMIKLDDTHLVGVYGSYADNTAHFSYLTKVDPKDVVPKTTLTLATLRSDSNITQAVISFNKTNPKYNIRIVDYCALYGDGSSWGDVPDSVLEKLNVDIISGNVPDILVSSIIFANSMSIDPYIRKGLIEDLNPYIEADPDMSISDFDPHILDLYSKDGKLYSLVPYYDVDTMLANKDIFGDRYSWSINEAAEKMKKDGYKYFMDMSDRDEVLQKMLILSGNQFIDWDNASCNFDSIEFRHALEFLKAIPIEYDWNDYSEECMKNGSTLTENYKIYGFDVMQAYFYERYGKAAALIGFPAGSQSGSCIFPELKISMSSKSENKDGVWEFIRYFLTDEFQGSYNCCDYAIPLKLKYLNAKFDKAKQPPVNKYTDYYTGEEISNPYTYMVGGEQKPVPGMTDQEIEDLKAFMNRVNTVNECDPKVVRIIQDETKEYFNGDSSIDDVCNRIQSRVQLYLYEIQ